MSECTEPLVADRFQDVASLRSATLLQLNEPSEKVTVQAQDLLTALQRPASLGTDAWLRIAHILESDDSPDVSSLMKALDRPQIEAIFELSRRLFGRIAISICRWIREGVFDFAFCDVLGARLEMIYFLGETRHKAEAAMAALHMGTAHHRWSVMRLFVRLAAPGINQDLADRLAIEVIAAGKQAAFKMRIVVVGISIDRASLHPKVMAAFERVYDSEGQGSVRNRTVLVRSVGRRCDARVTRVAKDATHVEHRICELLSANSPNGQPRNLGGDSKRARPSSSAHVGFARFRRSSPDGDTQESEASRKQLGPPKLATYALSEGG